MECLPKNEILEFREDTLEIVRKKHGLHEPGVMAAKVDELDNWVKSQNHFLKKDFPKQSLENIIISTKGSMEKAKKRIDKYCTLRSLHPRYFGDCDLKNDFPSHQSKALQAFLPKQTKDYSRIYIIKPIGSAFPSDIIYQGNKIMYLFTEYLRRHDYNDGYYIIVDYSKCNLFSMLARLSYSELMICQSIFMDGYGARIKGVHYISPSVILNDIISILKRLVNTKVASRFHIHKDMESVQKMLADDKDILPEEYGGQEKSLTKLHDDWVEVLSSEGFRSYLREINYGVDETLRKTNT